MCGTISLAYICREERREREEEFPELLLSSLDQLCLGKQQQLFLVSDVLCFAFCCCLCIIFSLFVCCCAFVFVAVYSRAWALEKLCLGKQQQLFLVCDVLCFPLCVCAFAFFFLCFIAIVLLCLSLCFCFCFCVCGCVFSCMDI